MELTGIYWNEGDQGLLVKKGVGASLNSVEAFDGKTVAAQNGTNQQIMVEEQLPNAKLELVTKIPDGVNMVKTGRVDALAVPKTVYDNVLARTMTLRLRTLLSISKAATTLPASRVRRRSPRRFRS